jgi:hypothetical protein
METQRDKNALPHVTKVAGPGQKLCMVGGGSQLVLGNLYPFFLELLIFQTLLHYGGPHRCTYDSLYAKCLLVGVFTASSSR